MRVTKDDLKMETHERRPTMGSGSTRRSVTALTDGDELAELELKIEDEKRYRDTILWSVGVLQHSVEDLESQLHDLQRDHGFTHLETEYKYRTKTQLKLNHKLEDQIDWYEKEIRNLKNKSLKGQDISYHDDLNAYTEFELKRMVEQLERERNILSSDLKQNAWLLDSHSKVVYQARDVAEAYRYELQFQNKTLENFWRQFKVRKPSGNNIGQNYTPMTSPGSLKWSSAAGVHPSQRIIDARKGPIRKIASVRSLPRMDFEEIDAHQLAMKNREARSKLRGGKLKRAKSLDSKHGRTRKITRGPAVRHRSLVETRLQKKKSASLESIKITDNARNSASQGSALKLTDRSEVTPNYNEDLQDLNEYSDVSTLPTRRNSLVFFDNAEIKSLPTRRNSLTLVDNDDANKNSNDQEEQNENLNNDEEDNPRDEIQDSPGRKSSDNRHEERSNHEDEDRPNTSKSYKTPSRRDSLVLIDNTDEVVETLEEIYNEVQASTQHVSTDLKETQSPRSENEEQ